MPDTHVALSAYRNRRVPQEPAEVARDIIIIFWRRLSEDCVCRTLCNKLNETAGGASEDNVVALLNEINVLDTDYDFLQVVNFQVRCVRNCELLLLLFIYLFILFAFELTTTVQPDIML